MSIQPKKPRLIAFYLPQFHPIPENDNAWGKGFTEWTNVTKTTPIFQGHVQPKLPADLGFYDLRLPDVRIQQAKLANDYGIEGFCYWHYWLGNGRRLLERPFQEVLRSKEPDFPFCLGWANHSWVGKGWMGGSDMNIVQTYPGEDDANEHFQFLLAAFQDSRYIKVHGKPLLVIYKPHDIPNPINYFKYWRHLAQQSGFPDLFIIADTPGEPSSLGVDGSMYSGQRHLPSNIWDEQSSLEKLKGINLKKAPYHRIINHLIRPQGYDQYNFPVILPNWDTTPRLGHDAMIFYGNNPSLFQIHVKQIIKSVMHKDQESNLIFIRAWNEWAEGNYLEPDMEFGHGYLRVLKYCLDEFIN